MPRAGRRSKKSEDLHDLISSAWDAADFASRRARMESDYGLYRQNEFDAGDGYQSYTSNRPRTLADKIISWMSEARMVARVPFNPTDPEGRSKATLKERWVVGTLQQIDDQLCTTMMPPLRETVSFHIVVRGWYAGRAIMNKRKDGTAFPDVMPFDPMRVVYGTDRQGLSWLAHCVRFTLTEIEDLYDIRIDKKDRSTSEEEDILLFDYYDRENHALIVDKRFAKQPTPHKATDVFGDPVVPCFLGFVGPAPYIQPDVSGDDTAADFGESVFAHNRTLYNTHNKTMSDMATLVRRSVRHPYVITSPDGSATLGADPWREGSEVPLKAGQKLELLPEIKMAQDAAAFAGLTSSEIQIGGLADVNYGNLQFQLSGHAANILRSGAEHQIGPRIAALDRAYRQIASLLITQFESEGFGKMTVTGRHGPFKTWFREEIEAKDIKDAGPLEIQHKPSLPQDMPSQVSMAQMLREGKPTPLAPDAWILDEILDVQDVDEWRKQIAAQQGEVAEPKAFLLTVMEGLISTGQSERAMIYVDALMRQLKKDQMGDALAEVQFNQMVGQMASGGAGQPPGVPGGTAMPQGMGGAPAPGGPGSLGVPADVVSSAAQGFPPAPPVAPQGVVAPGTPRPGAQGGDQVRMALNALGLDYAPG